MICDRCGTVESSHCMEIVIRPFTIEELVEMGDDWLPKWGDHRKVEAWCPECQFDFVHLYDVRAVEDSP